MNPLHLCFSRLTGALAQYDRRWAVVGGFAVGARTEPRFTRDIDVAIAVDADQEAEAVVRHVRAAGLEVFALLEQASVERLATARLRAPDGVVVDLLFASSGLEPELVRDAEPLTVLGVRGVPIPRVGHLIAMKLLSESDKRIKDRLDLQLLFAVADADEVKRAAVGVELISTRGFARGKDLPTLLREWAARERPDLLQFVM